MVPQFERVLDGHDPLVVGEEFDERIEERRLAAAGAAAHQDVATGEQGPLGRGGEWTRRGVARLTRRRGRPPRPAARGCACAPCRRPSPR